MLIPMRICVVKKNKTSHLFIDVDVTGVNAVPEKVLCAAITAAQVAVMEQLPAQKHRGTHFKGWICWKQIQVCTSWFYCNIYCSLLGDAAAI